MSSVAFAVCAASAFTSDATTAKPRPASPARAASIVAFSASKLVCAAMDWISLTTPRWRKRTSKADLKAAIKEFEKTRLPDANPPTENDLLELLRDALGPHSERS